MGRQDDELVSSAAKLLGFTVTDHFEEESAASSWGGKERGRTRDGRMVFGIVLHRGRSYAIGRHPDDEARVLQSTFERKDVSLYKDSTGRLSFCVCSGGEVSPRGKKPSVFICYAKENSETAERIWNWLSDFGVEPWLDRRNLVAGDIWEDEIKKAVKKADAFVVCLDDSFKNKGFRQQEVRWAIEAVNQYEPGVGFIIPFIVEPCMLPEWVQKYHAGSHREKATTKEELLVAIRKHCGIDS